MIPGLYSPCDDHDKPPALFERLSIPGTSLELKNRIGVAPMCMYSAADGHVSAFHQVHVPSFALYGASIVLMEATSIVPNGRITSADTGLWSDTHIPGLKRIVDIVHQTKTAIGIQLAHAGRKGSTYPPFIGEGHSRALNPGQVDNRSNVFPQTYHIESIEGYPVDAPSAIAYSDKLLIPHELNVQEIKEIVKAFGQAAIRADKAGFDVVEIHAAHGYLIHQFLSPLSNNRSDLYGGSFENRARFVLEVCREVKRVWPVEKAIFIRLSCTDFVSGGWTIDDTVELVKLINKEKLVHLVHCSAGGLSRDQNIPSLTPGYQVPFAKAIKDQVSDVLVAAVGLISDPLHANEIIDNGHADVIMMAREFIRNPAWPLQAASKLNCATQVGRMPQYNRSRESHNRK